MRTLIFIVAICIALVPGLATAHHPAEDIVDAEIYAFIDEMVADTPHATLDLDDTMGDGDDTSVLTTEFVSTAEALIQQGLLSHLSLLDGDVTVTIEFSPTLEAEKGIFTSIGSKPYKQNGKHKKWTEWGGEVVITIEQIYETD